MDRFQWCKNALHSGEQLIDQQSGVALYDGNEKTPFEHGILFLTTHRIIWNDSRNESCVLCLPLQLVVYLEEQKSGFSKSAKIVVHLHPPPSPTPPGPFSYHSHSYIRLSFREMGHSEMFRSFSGVLRDKPWLPGQQSSSGAGQQLPQIRPGIVGIERSLEKRNQERSENISVAFTDLSKLMEKAKEMVNLSKTIAIKIREKKGDISENETIKFKSYLLSMGISNPVTRESHGTSDHYFVGLARQLTDILTPPVQESGGMISLTDAYCRVNRARGLELLSPEDLLHACELMEMLDLSIQLKTFDSGVMVLQLKSQNDSDIVSSTVTMVMENGSLTAEELSQSIGVPVLLARERLLLTEKAGQVCRDEHMEGLRFYPNKFLQQQ